MVNARHKYQTRAQGIHTVAAYEYANAADRLAATGFTTDDLHKVAFQIDDATYYFLEGISPVSWQLINSGSTNQTLEETLVLGNSTGPNNIHVDEAGRIVFGNDYADDGVIALSNGNYIFTKNANGSSSFVLLGSDGYDRAILGGIPFQNTPTLGVTQDGYVATYVNSSGQIEWLPGGGGGGPTTLAGDVTGPSGSNTVIKINGAPVTTIGSANTVLLTTDGTNITYGQIVNAQVHISAAIRKTKLEDSAGLSVVGRSANSTGVLADITATATGQVLRYSGSTIGFGALDLSDTDAVTGTLPAGNQASQTMAGDVTGTTAAATVVKWQGRAVSSSAPTDGYVPTWDSGSSTWVTTGHFIDMGANYIKFGGASASAGQIRQPHGVIALAGRNNANNADGNLMSWGTTGGNDAIRIGDNSVTALINYSCKASGTHTLNIDSTAEHIFSASSYDAKTNYIDMQNQTLPSEPAAGFRILSHASGGLMALSSTGILTSIAPY